MSRADIAIIGSGPAGISAAITATIRNKKVLLFGSAGMSEKVSKAHAILNYPGLPNISGADLAAALQNHLDSMNIPVMKEQVTNIYAMGEYFAIQTPTNMYEAETVILATGVVQGKPLPGENELLGRGVSYCATCDAQLYRGKTVAVLGYNDEAVEETEFLATVCEKVYYMPVKGNADFHAENISVISGKPQAILGERQAEALETSKTTLPVDGVFILKDAVSPDKLVPGLQIEDNHVVVDNQMRSNLPGLFACGDIAGKPYQYIKSAGQGNIAALSAVSFLSEKKKNQ